MILSVFHATLIASAIGVQADDSPVSAAIGSSSSIKIRYAEFDPLNDAPEIEPALRGRKGQNLWIVQFEETPTQSGRDAIDDASGEIVSYLPENAYVVRMSAAEHESLEDRADVRWIGRYHPAYRLQSELITNRVYENPDAVRYNIVVANKRTDKPALIKKIQGLGGAVVDRHVGGLLLEARLTGAQLLGVAGLDEVLWIDRWTPIEFDMDNARIQGGGNYVETQAGYTGTGVNTHIYEGVEATHPDFTGTVTNVQSGGQAERHGHATAGIVFGNGTSLAAVRGMAPNAGKFYTNINTATASRNQIFNELTTTHNVSHSTASWGNNRTTEYNSISADSDDAVFDNDMPWTQSQSNAGDQMSRPQAWAKNVISVGGVAHYNNSNAGDDSWAGGNASIGPAEDGRIKPTLCAYYDATGTSDLTGSAGYSPGNWNANFGGTSGATPIVAGHNTLAIQMFTDEGPAGFGAFGNVLRTPGGTSHQNKPHFTTLKALMVASANQYAFTGASADNRREHQGWGFPSLRNLWDLRAKTMIIDEVDVIAQGDTTRYDVNVPAGEPALKVVLNWSEPAANPTSMFHLINNLSLRVTSPSGAQIYWGNNNLENGVWSTAGGSEDTINSIECVFVQNPTAGIWKVEVLGTSIVQDNHLETAAVDADYGLVICGVTTILPVELSRFAALRLGNGNGYLGWVTLAEVDTAGFNLYRAPSASATGPGLPASAVQVNSTLIPSRGGPFQSEVYRHLDSGTNQAERYVYWLEDIDIQGRSTMHGPFDVR